MTSTEEGKSQTSEYVHTEMKDSELVSHPHGHDAHHVVHGLVEPTRLFGEGRPFFKSSFYSDTDLETEDQGHVTKKYLLPRPTNDPKDPLVCNILIISKTHLFIRL